MKYFLIIAVTFLSIMNLNAFDEITMSSGKVYTGYVYFDNGFRTVMTDLNGTKVVLAGDSIKSREKLICEVYTVNNSVYKVKLNEVLSKKIIFQDENNTNFEIQINDLSHIIVAGKRLDKINWEPIKPKTALPDAMQTSSDNYPSVGLSIGMPSIINAIAAYDAGCGIGFQVSGGYINDKYYGGEFNLNLSLFKRKSAVMHFFIGAGTLCNGTEEEKDWIYTYKYKKNWDYFVTGFDVNVYGVYAKVGMSFGDGSLSSKVYNVMASIGYVLRFNE